MTSPMSYLAAGCQQVAFVVEDIAVAENTFCNKLGIPRFCRFNNFPVENGMYRGKPVEFHYHLSIAYSGEMQIELIQHLEGENIYREFLERQGTGVHHLGYLLTDHEKVVQDFSAQGHPIVQGGNVGGTDFAYFDLQTELGIFIETIVPDAEGRKLFARIKAGDF